MKEQINPTTIAEMKIHSENSPEEKNNTLLGEINRLQLKYQPLTDLQREFLQSFYEEDFELKVYCNLYSNKLEFNIEKLHGLQMLKFFSKFHKRTCCSLIYRGYLILIKREYINTHKVHCWFKLDRDFYEKML